MTTKRKYLTELACGHSSKGSVVISYGIRECGICGEPGDPSRYPELQIGPRTIISAGDLVRVEGIGICIFRYAHLEAEDRIAVWVSPLDGGRPHGFRAVTPDRIRRASRKREAR